MKLKHYNTGVAIERFYDNYPPVPELRQQVLGEQERFCNFDDPLIYLSDALTKVCAAEIKTVSDSLDLPSTPEAGSFLFQQTKKESASLIFGLAIRGLHEAVQQSYFEHDVLLSRLNNALTGTPMSEFKQPAWMESCIEGIDTTKHHEMKKAINTDPTFAVFFEQPELMPNNLRKFLDGHQLLSFDYIPVIAKEWKERAQFVLDAQHNRQEMKVDEELRPLNSLATFQINDLLANF